jgi:uncharacterized protein YggE
MKVRVAAIVAALSLISAPAALADTPPTLAIDGAGKAFVVPDLASLSLSVARSAATSSGALSAANHRVAIVVAALRAAGVAERQIQTTSVSVSRGTIRVGPRKRRVARFTASEALAVTVTDVHTLGRVVDGATRAGADSVDGPSYSFSDPSAGRAVAARAALADARRRADDACAAIGYRVTGIQSVAIDPQSPVAPFAPGGTSNSAPPSSGTPTKVNPGVQEVDSSVHVVYTIAPA